MTVRNEINIFARIDKFIPAKKLIALSKLAGRRLGTASGAVSSVFITSP
jgi:hypothetical protein